MLQSVIRVILSFAFMFVSVMQLQAKHDQVQLWAEKKFARLAARERRLFKRAIGPTELISRKKKLAKEKRMLRLILLRARRAGHTRHQSGNTTRKDRSIFDCCVAFN